ncbi:uncharacterized protein [Haliotis cracherodii]|uniref:uncharacterized protein isoform X1 n=1 Tax=Haliotis cracherodii TaxID=6455 RepID=UPI0039EA9768
MSRIGAFKKRTFEKMENLLIIILLCNFTALCKGGSLHLFSSPPTATDGGLFTLVCTNRSRGISGMKWYLNDNQAFTTNAEGAKEMCSLGKISSSPIKYKGRFTFSCDDLQHNITLTINSTLDNGSVWYCEDNAVTGTTQVTRLKSNKCIINVTTVGRASTWTYGSSTSSTAFGPFDLDNSSTDTQNIVYAAAGGGGGVVFIMIFILGVVCVRRRRHRTCNAHIVKENRHPSTTENGLRNSAFQNDSSNEDIMVENDLYQRSSVVSPASDNLGNTDGVTAHIVKENRHPPTTENGLRNSAFQNDSSNEDIMVENDLYQRSSVVSPASDNLGNTDGVTDIHATVNKVEKDIPEPPTVPVIVSPIPGNDLAEEL